MAKGSKLLHVSRLPTSASDRGLCLNQVSESCPACGVWKAGSMVSTWIIMNRNGLVDHERPPGPEAKDVNNMLNKSVENRFRSWHFCCVLATELVDGYQIDRTL